MHLSARACTALFLTGLVSAQGVDDRPDRRVEDRKLQLSINEAIFRGVDYLKQTQHSDGSWAWSRDDGRGGMTALALYALSASGIRKDDPTMQKGLAWVENHDGPFSERGRYGTYSASLLILALTRIDPKKYRNLILRCARRIVAAQLSNGQWTYSLFNIRATGTLSPKERRQAVNWRTRTGDNSNSQFAVLALWAAEAIGRCNIPNRTWRKIELFYRQTQLRDGSWSYRPPPRAATVAGAAQRRRQQKAPQVKGKPTMSAAGLVSYVYAFAGQRGGVRALAKGRAQSTAVRGLEAFYKQRNEWNWRDFYLAYGIERIGTVLAVPEERWYVHGARALTKSQHANGSWPAGRFGDGRGAYETALALLFLSKATAPAITRGQR